MRREAGRVRGGGPGGERLAGDRAWRAGRREEAAWGRGVRVGEAVAGGAEGAETGAGPGGVEG